MGKSRRYILKDDPVLRRSDYGIVVPGITSSNGWTLEGFYNATEARPRQTVYEELSKEHTIHLVEDEYIQVEYVMVCGPKPEDVLARAVRPLPCYSDDELWKLAESAAEPWQHIRSLYYLGVSAPFEAEQRRVEYFATMSRNDVPEVRKAAIVAMGYADWNSLVEELARVAQDDPDPAIRAHAESLREGYQREQTVAAD